MKSCPRMPIPCAIACRCWGIMLLVSLVTTGFGSFAANCWAVTILLKDSATPIKGFLVSESEARIVVDELLVDGKEIGRASCRERV